MSPFIIFFTWPSNSIKSEKRIQNAKMKTTLAMDTTLALIRDTGLKQPRPFPAITDESTIYRDCAAYRVGLWS